MLAVALNQAGAGAIDGKIFGQAFVRRFADFKVIKLMPIDNLEKGPLALCEPAGYEEITKDMKKTWDKTGTFLELTGLRDKLQRSVRQMFFFDQETKFTNILLHGCEGINNFPWAVQILLVQLPVPDWKQVSKMIKKADIIVINNAAEHDIEEFLVRVAKLGPHIPVFFEKLEEGLSQELQENLKSLLAAYEEKRSRVRAALEDKYPNQTIGCEQARGMARKLKVSLFLFGNVCDECGYRVTQCGLGCF
ncbi:MAG: hypothetical protein ABFD04_16490 [Syntrophomonas sp.]